MPRYHVAHVLFSVYFTHDFTTYVEISNDLQIHLPRAQLPPT